MAKTLSDVHNETFSTLQLADQLLSIPQHHSLFAADTTLKKLLHHARKTLDMEVAFVSEFLEGRRVFRYVDCDEDFRPFESNDSDPIDLSYCIRVVDGRLPELILNTQENPITAQLEATQTYCIGNYIGVPIILSDNTVYGTCCCFSRQPDYTINQRDVENFRFLAHCAALVIERDICGLRGIAQKRKNIKQLIDQRQFFPVFQPVFDLKNHQVTGFEALTRFVAQPRRTPQHWFNEASDVGLQQALELATLHSALAAVGLPLNKTIAVNLSPDSILEQQQAIVRALPRNQTIAIEITEHDIIEDYDLVNRALAPLRELGIKLAVDDVGAGFACLKHILLLKPDIIKIDQSIVKAIDHNKDAQAITRAMVTFAQEIQCEVIAEGIETAEELAMLKQLNVAKGQGFLLGAPNKGALQKWG